MLFLLSKQTLIVEEKLINMVLDGLASQNFLLQLCIQIILRTQIVMPELDLRLLLIFFLSISVMIWHVNTLISQVDQYVTLI